MEKSCKTKLEDILSDKHISYILEQTVKTSCKIVGYEVRSASDGLSGFLGDHFKIVLKIEEGGTPRRVHLFVKTLPLVNKPKADFIDKYNFFRREALLYKLLQEDNGPAGTNSWFAKVYIYTEDRIVLANLSEDGYVVRPVREFLDMNHILVTIKTVAQYHASIANCLGRKSFNTSELCKSYDGFEHYLKEPTWRDGPWIRVGAKLAADFLKEFSVKYENCDVNLEEKLARLFVQACDTLNNNEDTLNVIIHKDLWVNNILYKYENNVPINAVLIDFQCTTYAPPAFDVMVLLYLTTSKAFRKKYENEIFDIYFSIFLQNTTDTTRQWLQKRGYNRESLQELCERARMFALVDAIGIFPYILLDPHAAKEIFDEPTTFDKYQFEDRSEPVINYARKCTYYREKLLEVCEEFLERYILC